MSTIMINKITSSAAFKRVEHKTKPARRFILKFLNDWSLDFASMVAYNLLIALLPIAVLLFGILGLILRNHPQAQEDLKNKIIHSFPADNATQTGITQIVNLAFDQLSEDAGVILVIGIVSAIFGSSRLFIVVDKCMTIIYRLPERPFLRQYLMGLGMLFLFILLISLMLAASSAPSALINMISSGGGQFGAFIAGILISLAIAFCLFEIIYLLIPNKKMTFKQTWCGSLVAAIILEIFIIVFPLYVRQCMSNYSGQIAFGVILILFLYYFAVILILGAQLNAHFFEQYPPLTEGLGTYVSQMHREHGVGDSIESLHDYNNEQQLSTTTTDSDNQRRTSWLKKLWPSKQRRSIQPEIEENHDV